VGGGGSCDDPNNMPYPLRLCHMLETTVTPSIIPLSVYNDDSVVALVSFAFPSNSTLVAIQARADSFKEFVCFTCAFSIITCPDGCSTSIWGQLSEYLCHNLLHYLY
jgi:hypothetical protein